MKIKRLSNVILIKGILLILLGIVHMAFSYFEYQFIKTEMSVEMSIQYILWFFVVGMFILFIGITDIFSYKAIKQGIKWIWKVTLLSAVFSFITGFLGVITFNWKLCPPYVLLILGLVHLLILFLNCKLILRLDI